MQRGHVVEEAIVLGLGQRHTGLMVPVALGHSGNKGWQIVHRCRRCGGHGTNKVASETQQPDDVARVAALSGRRA